MNQTQNSQSLANQQSANQTQSSASGFEATIRFPKAYSELDLGAQFRSCPEDFIVKEDLGFEASGSGEHWLLHIEKIGQNTHWVAEQLAKFCELPLSSVGQCGRKDRHAVTRQWFSLYAPKQTKADWSKLDIEGVSLLSVSRHSQKLRLGSHRGNEFIIRLRDVRHKGNELNSDLQQQLKAELYQRCEQGVPNYFGEQRFGRAQSNLIAADQWFSHKHKPHPKRKSMVMSAARSYLFNLVLAERIRQNNWQRVLAGDVIENSLPTGPLWGRGRPLVSDLSLAIEEKALSELNEWRRGLEYCGLKQERRSLIVKPSSMKINWRDQDLELSFSLPVGCFATSLLIEICELQTDRAK